MAEYVIQFFGCRVHINSAVPSTKLQTKMLLNKGDDVIPLTLHEELTLATVRTIDTVKTINKVSQWVVKATIIQVQFEKAPIGNITRHFSCNHCGTVTDVLGKIRTTVRVNYETGAATLILF